MSDEKNKKGEKLHPLVYVLIPLIILALVILIDRDSGMIIPNANEDICHGAGFDYHTHMNAEKGYILCCNDVPTEYVEHKLVDPSCEAFKASSSLRG
jgi:hypothetical protein